MSRDVEAVIATVAHELRAPLASIRAAAEILRDNPQIDAPERNRFLAVVVQESERLSRLIGQLLDLSRLDAGLPDWEPTRVDLKSIALYALEAMAPMFSARGITLTSLLPDGVPCVTADHDRLVQVLINLLSNAAKFAPAGDGRVVVELQQRPGGVLLQVVDNGPGIPQEDLQAILERRPGQGMTGTGAGLGLPISRRIIERCGGRLTVESEPGRGTRFAFELPAAHPAEGS